MDALKLIPEVFFDVIARVVPGGFCLVCLQATTHAPILQWIFEGIVPQGPLRTSSVLWILSVTASAYVVGHFMSPFVRYLEWSPGPSTNLKCKRCGSGHGAKDDGAPTTSDEIAKKVQAVRELILPFQRPGSTHPACVWWQYDWLRLEKPEVGGIVARIRAEYTMYGGFAAALIVTVVVILSRSYLNWAVVHADGSQPFNTTNLEAALQVSAAATAAVVMLHRHYNTYYTFKKSVKNFYRAAEGAERWKSDFFCANDLIESAALSTNVRGSEEVSTVV